MSNGSQGLSTEEKHVLVNENATMALLLPSLHFFDIITHAKRMLVEGIRSAYLHIEFKP